MLLGMRFCFLTEGQALTFIKKQNSNTNPTFGAPCFPSYVQNFPYHSHFSCELSNRIWISEVGNGRMREATPLASGLRSKVTDEVWILILALSTPRLLLNPQSELGRSSTSDCCSPPQQPPSPGHPPLFKTPWRSLRPEETRRAREGEQSRRSRIHATCPAIAAWLIISQLNDHIFSFYL